MTSEARNFLETVTAKVREGRFKEHMDVSLVNDGPATFVIDTKELQ